METILAEETLGLTKLNQETNQSNFLNNYMNIYVGNIPWGVSEEELEGLFGQYGEVNSVRIITDRESGRSKGCLLYTSPSPRDATLSRMPSCA